MNHSHKYCENLLSYRRRPTRVVYVGEVGIGGDHPIRVQSMTIADTLDTEATVREIQQLAEVGCEVVRVTAPSLKEAENLKNIKAELNRYGVKVPLVADIHFTPNAALVAAEYVEKVRINPGNYADKKKFEQREYTDEEYQAELRRIEEKFKPLVLKCKKLGRALRIGTNHGSLSDRIMNRYGDTPAGMVESALEFVRICQKYDFHDIVLSMKSSNPQVAIQAYRLLAARMLELGMDYPFHLGVTEAGDGEEGRIKSAIGIGALLEDGIGDTIRVSLTEDAVAEVPVAFQIAQKYNELSRSSPQSEKLQFFTLSGVEGVRNLQENMRASTPLSWKPNALREFWGTPSESNGFALKLPDPFASQRRDTLSCELVFHQLGNGQLSRVELSLSEPFSNIDSTVKKVIEMLGSVGNGQLNVISPGPNRTDFKCETVHVQLQTNEDLRGFEVLHAELHRREIYVPFAVEVTQQMEAVLKIAASADRLVYAVQPNSVEQELQQLLRAAGMFGRAVEWKISSANEADSKFHFLSGSMEKALLVCEKADFWNLLFSLDNSFSQPSLIAHYRFLAGRLDALGAPFPILLRYTSDADFDHILLDASTQLGVLLCDGIGDAIHIQANLPADDLLRLSYNILQAARARISKTEFISCPSCGRTLFDLQTTTERIKSKTGHLKGVKIAIMGCIVNGPGEMADADFGYVGAGPQKVNLFVGKECVKRNIAEEVADEKLIELIKAHEKWVEP